ncbi:MAG: hypothetical protein KJ072_03115 [Verrucomicrobia bacterium]|nr:hypothetical protein [Verrucomicrobiota bacterium]
MTLSADLIRIAGGRQQWAEKLPSDPTNLVGAQLKLVTSLAESRGLVWDREHRAAVRTRLENAIRAYELVQRARRSWGDRRENFTTQIRCDLH